MQKGQRIFPGRGSLGRAISLGLGWGTAGILTGISVPAVGAEPPKTEEYDEPVFEEVTVTGSRIPRADIESASPVTVVERDEIEATGLTDIGALLQSLPAMSGSPINTTVNNGGNGSVLLDLRGIGSDRTLVLINGRRVVSGDFQAIPSTMIERIEVLKDGASAVYGADAVAGVVNVITRRDFQGMEFGAEYSDHFKMDAGRQQAVSFIVGTEFARGNFVFGAEYVDQQAAYQSDTPWEFFQDTYYIYPEGCEHTLTQPYPQGCYPIGSTRIPEGRLTFLSQGRFMVGTPAEQPYEVGTLAPYDGRQYNYSPINYIQTPYNRTNVFAEGHFDLTGTTRFNFEIRASHRESAQELAPLPYDTRLDPAHDGVFNGIPYHGISQDNYYLRRAIDRYNAETGSSLVYEPVVDGRRRMIETNRRFEQDVTQFQWLAAVQGAIGNYHWEIFLNQSQRSAPSTRSQAFWGSAVADALGPSADLDGDGQPECYRDINDPQTVIPGCVPLNMFGGGEVDPVTSVPTVTTVTEDMLDYLYIDLLSSFKLKSTQAGLAINGSSFELPGGPVGWAVGYDHWRQDLDDTPDSALASGNVAGGNNRTGTKARLTNNSVYFEALAPLWDNGTQNLYLKAGVRYDDWSAFSGDWTWQLGLELQAFDALKLRGTAGTVFRAPEILDLYAGGFGTFGTVRDPCYLPPGDPLPPGCERYSPPPDTERGGHEIRTHYSGNPELVPETGDTFTAGLVWTPDFGGHRLTLTLDYWKIDLEDAIRGVDNQYLVDDCSYNANPITCALIMRDESDYDLVSITNYRLNLAHQGASGVDGELRWSHDSAVGRWQASLLWAHMLERTKIAFEGDPKEDLAGRYTEVLIEDGGARPEDKINFSLRWSLDDLSLGWLVQYISGMDADTFCNCDSDNDPSNNLPDGRYIQNIDAVMYHDLVASYVFESFGTRISAGVTNITNEPPPFIEVGFNATTEPSTYRLFGRGYYLRLSWEF